MLDEGEPVSEGRGALRGLQKTQNALVRLFGLAGQWIIQIINTSSRMGLHIEPVMLRLARNLKDGKQDGVLEHVGPVTGMISVLIGKQGLFAARAERLLAGGLELVAFIPGWPFVGIDDVEADLVEHVDILSHA